MRNSPSGFRPHATEPQHKRFAGHAFGDRRDAAGLRGGITGLDVTIDVQRLGVAGELRIVGPDRRVQGSRWGCVDDEALVVDRATTSVVKTLTKPFTAQLTTSDGTTISMPSHARQWETGVWDVVDYRPDEALFKDAATRRQMSLNRLVSKVLKARHVCEVRETLGSRTFLKNVSLIAVYRTIVPTTHQRATAARMLAGGTVVPLGDLADALHPIPTNGMALAFALMLRRMIAIDMETTLGPGSLVRAVRPPPARLPGLFDAVRLPPADA